MLYAMDSFKYGPDDIVQLGEPRVRVRVSEGVSSIRGYLTVQVHGTNNSRASESVLELLQKLEKKRENHLAEI